MEVCPFLSGHLGRIEVGKAELRSSGERVAYPLRHWVGMEADRLVAGMGLMISFGTLLCEIDGAYADRSASLYAIQVRSHGRMVTVYQRLTGASSKDPGQVRYRGKVVA